MTSELKPDWEGFGRDLMQDWPVRDVDGAELFEAALRNGLVREVPGGYDPEQHIDAEGICPETGDPWYEYAFPHTRAPAPAVKPTLAQINELAKILMDEWYRVDPKSSVTQHPASYVANFADMARAALASKPPAPAVDPMSDPRVVALVELLKEARDDIETYVDHDWPENLRAQYPTYQSKWNRDMDLCRRIDAALAALDTL